MINMHAWLSWRDERAAARARVSGQADDGRVHEPGEDVGSSDSGGEIPAAVDLPADPDAGRVGGGRRVHGINESHTKHSNYIKKIY
jgi:hypothetical protein